MKKKINSFVEIANEEVFSINGEINNLHEMLTDLDKRLAEACSPRITVPALMLSHK